MLGTICLTLAIDGAQDEARYKRSGFDVATKPEIEILQQNGWMKFGELKENFYVAQYFYLPSAFQRHR